jgi:hypothetical protein
METDFSKLEELLREVNAEVERLKRVNDPDSFIPLHFRRETAKEFLKNPSLTLLDKAFKWASTPQGEFYWEEISEGLEDGSIERVPDEAIIAIQKWIINSVEAGISDD